MPSLILTYLEIYLCPFFSCLNESCRYVSGLLDFRRAIKISRSRFFGRAKQTKGGRLNSTNGELFCSKKLMTQRFLVRNLRCIGIELRLSTGIIHPVLSIAKVSSCWLVRLLCGLLNIHAPLRSIYSCKIKSQRLKFEGEANSLHLNFQEQRDIISYPYVASRDDDGTQRWNNVSSISVK